MSRNLKIAFNVSILCILTGGHVDAVDIDDESIFKRNGWEKIAIKELKSSGGSVSGNFYTKMLEGRSVYSIYLPGKDIVWFGESGNNCIFIKDRIMWIGWSYPASLLYNDVNVSLEGDDDLARAIISSEVRLKSEPRSMTKIRRYKGAFGLVETNDGKKVDLTFGLMRIMKDYRFKGVNLEITISGGPGDSAIIVLTPGLEYVSSSVNGKPVDPKIVESGPAITAGEHRRKRDEELEARKREMLKSPEESK
ncbi:MAG: hypothetical protein EOP87_04935 [Verrucomicrobiaceae bacterium]|nr:MAG: hypothetical protein EOP87_04935 [Verrucomicrobiaceae bacterium]